MTRNTETEVAKRASNGHSRRQFLRATGGVAAAAALPTAASHAAAKSDQNRGRQQGRRLQLINATMTSLDPIGASDTASGAVTTQIFDGLLYWPDGSVPVETLIATDYQVSNDFTTYTFDLKEGVQYHDEGEVTASDFVYAWERLAASENSLAPDDLLNAIGVVHETADDGSYVPDSKAVRAVDDYTLEMEIQQPFAPTLQVLANNQFAAVREGLVGDVEGYEGEMSQSEFSTNPVGAGPFRFEMWQPETEAAVAAFENYHGEGPQVAGVHWQVITDPTAAYNYAMNENADVFAIPTPQYDPGKATVERTDDQGRKFGTYGPLRNEKTANYQGVVTLNVFYIGFNMPSVPKPVRQAVAYAMNQQTVVEQVFKGRHTPAYHYTSPSVYPGGETAYTQHARQNYPYGHNQSRLQEARRVMEEADYGQNNRYELTFTIYESDTWEQTAQILRDQLANSHIDMNIERAPFSTLLTRVREGNIQSFSLGWVVPWAAPDAFVKHLVPATSDPEGEVRESYTSWPETPAAQRANRAWTRVENNTAPTDEARQIRNEAYITIEEANWEDVANLPVYHETEERFWYQDVTIPPFGVGGAFKQKFNQVGFGG